MKLSLSELQWRQLLSTVGTEIRRRKDDLMANHGTRASYNKGCHCRPCTIANRIYARKHWRQTRGATGWINIDPEQEEYEQKILASVDNETTDERTAV